MVGFPSANMEELTTHGTTVCSTRSVSLFSRFMSSIELPASPNEPYKQSSGRGSCWTAPAFPLFSTILERLEHKGHASPRKMLISL
jgi:hypothetical protein